MVKRFGLSEISRSNTVGEYLSASPPDWYPKTANHPREMHPNKKPLEHPSGPATLEQEQRSTTKRLHQYTLEHN
jgi:hypothetical protein